jgi:hypothetical protein
MRVSLRPLANPASGAVARGLGAAARPLLEPAGPICVLGSRADEDALSAPVAPSPQTMFGPRGAALAGAEGPLFVTDTGHHRLLIWLRSPEADHTPADLLIGQPDFFREGRNAKGEPGAATLNVPTGVAACGDALAVADAWNHRVLIWRGLPQENNRPADVVLGQADFTGMLANRGGEAGPHTLNWCYGVSIADGRLIVCDTGNRRVLVWNEIPDRNGAPADLVLGQTRMDCRDENGGRAVDAGGMRWPHAAAMAQERLIVADAGDNRLMVWNAMPRENGAPCDFVIGQLSAFCAEHNRAAYWPDAASLNMPYGCAATTWGLAVADTANSRLLGYDEFHLGAAAVRLTGQGEFSGKGDNRWKAPARDSLCWPYGIAVAGDVAAIADSGNNRALLWRLAP